jgi:ubiquinone/menaquinone biosynthesis C-methylase UbiE
MQDDYGALARTFDAVAPGYDAVYGPAANRVMGWMRRENLALLQRYFRPGQHLLEIGCGTGDEAIALASWSCTVVATDISPAMVSLTERKAAATGLSGRVSAVSMAGAKLHRLAMPAAFDGAYASFGSLNCEPNLEALGAALAVLLKPGAYFVCSVMARISPFEMGWHLAHARPARAFRRVGKGWSQATLATPGGRGLQVAVRYISASAIQRAFGPDLTLEQTVSLGLLMPPPYLDTLFRKRRALWSRLEAWERRLRVRWPWRLMGDHVALVLRRR